MECKPRPLVLMIGPLASAQLHQAWPEITCWESGFHLVAPSMVISLHPSCGVLLAAVLTNVSVLWFLSRQSADRRSSPSLQTMSTVGLGFHPLPLPTILTCG